MPWTFAHPAAVLPLRRFCPAPLNLAALATGTLTPDFGYHLDQFRLATYAHTFPGAVVACLPIGLALLGCFYLVRRPLWYLLPQPHRAALQPLTVTPPPLGGYGLLSASASIVIGAWSHIVWDGFTHRLGWAVSQSSWLQHRIVAVAGTDFRVYSALQELSTLAGIAALAGAYFLWLRRRGVASVFATAREDWPRYAILTAVSAGSTTMAVLLGARTATVGGHFELHAFLFAAAVYLAAFFLPILTLTAVLFYVRRERVL